MTVRSPKGLLALSEFGSEIVTAVEGLTSAVLNYASKASGTKTGALTVEEISISSDGLSQKLDFQRGVNRSNVTTLDTLVLELDSLHSTVMDKVEDLSGWAIQPDTDDRLFAQLRSELIAAKLAHFQGMLGTLERCRATVNQLLASEHLVEDQLNLARTVTLPSLAHENAYAGLVQAADDGRALATNIDRHVQSLLATGFAPPVSRRPLAASLFCRLVKRGIDV